MHALDKDFASQFKFGCQIPQAEGNANKHSLERKMHTPEVSTLVLRLLFHRCYIPWSGRLVWDNLYLVWLDRRPCPFYREALAFSWDRTSLRHDKTIEARPAK